MVEFSWTDLAANSFGASALIAFLCFVFRGPLLKLATKSIEHRFDKRLETLRSEFRKKEQELEQSFAARQAELNQIYSLLGNLRTQRASEVQRRKLDAAEAAMDSCNRLLSLSMAAEMLQVIKVDVVASKVNEPSIREMFGGLVSSMKVDDRLEDQTQGTNALIHLHLDERTYAHYSAFSLTVFHAIGVMKCFSLGVDATSMFKKNVLRDKIVKIAPASAEGFDEHGEAFAYFWVRYLYDETVKGLRSFANGGEQEEPESTVAADFVVASQLASVEAQKRLQEAGFPSEMLTDPEASPRAP